MLMAARRCPLPANSAVFLNSSQAAPLQLMKCQLPHSGSAWQGKVFRLSFQPYHQLIDNYFTISVMLNVSAKMSLIPTTGILDRRLSL